MTTNPGAAGLPGGPPAPGPPAVGRTARMPVPVLLRDAAGWAWRLLVLAAAAYALVQLLSLLYLLVLPFVAALLGTALVQPVTRLIQRLGIPRLAATWLTVLIGFVVIGGIGFYVVNRATVEYPALVVQVKHVINHLRSFAIHHLHVKARSVDHLQTTIVNYLNKHNKVVLRSVVHGVSIVGEVIAGAILTFFFGFFLLYDGAQVWGWVVGLFPPSARDRADGAGRQAWARLAGYVRGTFVVAAFHGFVVGVTLLVLGAPLVAPLALLVFLGSFIPIIGLLVFGGLAAAVTFATKGAVAGIIFVVVLLIDNQVEAHVLQPLLVGRYVKLHPLAIGICIAGGGLLAGIEGAILAVPIVAVCYAVARYLATPDLVVATGTVAPSASGGGPAPPVPPPPTEET